MKKVTLELSAQELEMIIEPLVSVLVNDTHGTSISDDPKQAVKEWREQSAAYVSDCLRADPANSAREEKAKRLDFTSNRKKHDQTASLIEKIIGAAARPLAKRSMTTA
ncbi:MAG: hypothetical protein H7343_20300 [Undibacterium sp.]|nr:hypothetical protein [Opitutaceae bacterium]